MSEKLMSTVSLSAMAGASIDEVASGKATNAP